MGYTPRTQLKSGNFHKARPNSLGRVAGNGSGSCGAHWGRMERERTLGRWLNRDWVRPGADTMFSKRT
jgi:hypothetical protein